MTGQSLGDIIGDAISLEKREVNRQADRIMEMLHEHVPAPQQASLMVKLSSVMESLGDVHRDRIEVFNEVHRRLHQRDQ